MPNKTLAVRVDAKVTGADKLQGLGSKMRSTGTAMTAGITLPLVALGGALIGMAADAEKVEAKVSTAFESMGASAWTSLEELDEAAQAFARSTTFDDDAIKESQAVLLTFGNVGAESFDKATEAALNISTALGTDLQGATMMVGKALNDPIAGLAAMRRVGIQFTDQQREQITTMVEAGDTAGAQAVMLGELERQFGGMATAMAETSGGQMTQAMNQLGEAGEAMGALLLPVLGAVAGALAAVAGWVLSLDPGLQTLIIGVAAVAAAIGPVVLIIGSLIGAFGAVGTAFTVLSTLLMANPFILLIAAVVALVALIILNWDTILGYLKDAWQTISSGIGKLARFIGEKWDDITGVFRKAVRWIADIGGKLWAPIGTGFEAAIRFVKGIWNHFVGWWNGIQISVPSVDIPLVGRVGGFTIGLPDLPYLASGGIVTRPTLGVLGEAGPEAIIPLDKLSTGPREVHYHTHLTVMGDVKARDTREVEDALARVGRFSTAGAF